jgi:hypothetical protein
MDCVRSQQHINGYITLRTLGVACGTIRVLRQAPTLGPIRIAVLKTELAGSSQFTCRYILKGIRNNLERRVFMDYGSRCIALVSNVEFVFSRHFCFHDSPDCAHKFCILPHVILAS